MAQPFHNRDVVISYKMQKQARGEIFVKIYNREAAEEICYTKFIPEFALTLFCCSNTAKSVNTS